MYLIELIAVGAISQLTRRCLQSWWQSGCHPGSDSKTGNLRGVKETESKTIIWYIILQSYKTSFLPLYYAQRKKSHPKSSSHPQRMLCELDVGEMNWLIHNQIKKRKSCRASPGSWLASIILPLLVGRVYKPLPIAKELELKCWHTSCIMWHWSDECSAPKSSTLSLAWAGIWHNEDRCTIWLVSFGSEKKITGLPQLYKGYLSNIMAYNRLVVYRRTCMYV